MEPVMFQMGTIFFLAGMIVFVLLFLQKRNTEEKTGECIWSIRSSRVEPKASGLIRRLFQWHKRGNEAALEEGAVYLGNGMTDDIFLDTGGGRLRLYLNVMQEKIYLTVLKGSVRIGGYVYRKDATRQLVIRDYTEVFAQEAKLIFQRKQEGGIC